MFDIGFWELALIAIIALLVVGPERMPALAKKVGSYIGKLKKFIANVKSDVEDNINEDTFVQKMSLTDEKSKILEVVKDSKKQLSAVEKSIQNNTK